MGFWSTLGKIGSIAGPAAAMFVPGLQGVGAAGLAGAMGTGAKVANAAIGGLNAAGAIAQGRATGRQAEGVATMSQDAQRLQDILSQRQMAVAEAGIDLNRRQFAQDSRQTNLAQAIRGGLARDGQNFSMSMPGIPKPAMSGMMGPGSVGAEGRQAGDLMARQALMAMMKGESFDPVAKPAFTQSPLPQANWLDKILGIGGTVGGVLGGMASGAAGRPQAPPPTLNERGSATVIPGLVGGLPPREVIPQPPVLQSRRPLGF